MHYSRRNILKLGLSALPIAPLIKSQSSLFAATRSSKPNSNFGGIQVGIIAPYAFRGTARSAQEVLENMVSLGINAVELQNDPVEQFAGAPAQGGGRGRGRGRRTPEDRAAQQERGEELKKWRLSVSMNKFAALREMYEKAGIRIYAFKLGLNQSMSDGEYDYAFNVTKALGADHLTMEINENTARIGKFAAKHQVHVGYHNHTQVNESSWDQALEQSEFNGINLDVGHFTAAISKSPIPFIRKHHARIHSMHLKDRKYGTNGSANMPWGEGDTPLKEVLQLMKKEQYKFPATIELEYRVPEGSSVTAELQKCVEYCKKALA